MTDYVQAGNRVQLQHLLKSCESSLWRERVMVCDESHSILRTSTVSGTQDVAAVLILHAEPDPEVHTASLTTVPLVEYQVMLREAMWTRNVWRSSVYVRLGKNVDNADGTSGAVFLARRSNHHGCVEHGRYGEAECLSKVCERGLRKVPSLVVNWTRL